MPQDKPLTLNSNNPVFQSKDDDYGDDFDDDKESNPDNKPTARPTLINEKPKGLSKLGLG